jgi:hypothetical protein
MKARHLLSGQKLVDAIIFAAFTKNGEIGSMIEEKEDRWRIYFRQRPIAPELNDRFYLQNNPTGVRYDS